MLFNHLLSAAKDAVKKNEVVAKFVTIASAKATQEAENVLQATEKFNQLINAFPFHYNGDHVITGSYSINVFARVGYVDDGNTVCARVFNYVECNEYITVDENGFVVKDKSSLWENLLDELDLIKSLARKYDAYVKVVSPCGCFTTYAFVKDSDATVFEK